jgi:SAM-dependent methyltransferase
LRDLLVPQPDLGGLYDAHYYRTFGAPLGGEGPGDEFWRTFAGIVADGIVKELQPSTVLDAGCGRGFLVAALRDRGVEAYGMDFSSYAIEHGREDIRPFCWQGSITEPLPRRYDVITCLEVVEHVPAADAGRAIEVLCAAADDIVFSSTSTDFREQTHINVRPVEYWAGLFAQHGFYRDVDCDPLALGHQTFIRFRKRAEPVHRIVADYERRFWTLLQENAALRLTSLEAKAAFAKQDEALRAAVPSTPDVAALELTIAEQRQHLDALNDRLAFMSDRERDLRSLLLDAHQQLLQRDESTQQLRSEIDRSMELYRTETARRDEVIEAIQADSAQRLALIHRLTAEVQQHRAALDVERGAVATQTATIEQLTAELTRRDEAAAGLRRSMAERPVAGADGRSAAAQASNGAAAQAGQAAAPDRSGAAPADGGGRRASSPSIARRLGTAVRRQRGVWRIERGYRKLRRRFQG